LVNSYEDDDTEETFFLTEEGKKLIRKFNDQ
jgi:predicted transcriptional regulator